MNHKYILSLFVLAMLCFCCFPNLLAQSRETAIERAKSEIKYIQNYELSLNKLNTIIEQSKNVSTDSSNRIRNNYTHILSRYYQLYKHSQIIESGSTRDLIDNLKKESAILQSVIRLQISYPTVSEKRTLGNPNYRVIYESIQKLVKKFPVHEIINDSQKQTKVYENYAKAEKSLTIWSDYPINSKELDVLSQSSELIQPIASVSIEEVEAPKAIEEKKTPKPKNKNNILPYSLIALVIAGACIAFYLKKKQAR